MRYLGNLAVYRAGDAVLLGASELRTLVRQWISDPSAVDVVVAGCGAGLVSVVCVLGFREGRRRGAVLYAAPALMVLALTESPSPILQRNLFWVLRCYFVSRAARINRSDDCSMVCRSRGG